MRDIQEGGVKIEECRREEYKREGAGGRGTTYKDAEWMGTGESYRIQKCRREGAGKKGTGEKC